MVGEHVGVVVPVPYLTRSFASPGSEGGDGGQGGEGTTTTSLTAMGASTTLEQGNKVSKKAAEDAAKAERIKAMEERLEAWKQQQKT